MTFISYDVLIWQILFDTKQNSIQHSNTVCKGKPFSEALIFASANLQYDDNLFIELQVQYIKIPSSEHGENMLCTEIVFDIQNNFCIQHVLLMFWKKKNFWPRFTCPKDINLVK